MFAAGLDRQISALMPPLVIRAEIVALPSRGSRSLMPPLVHPSFTPPSGTRARSMSSPPFVVDASIWPPTYFAWTPPLVVSALMRPFSPARSIPPLVVVNFTSAPAGTFTWYST